MRQYMGGKTGQMTDSEVSKILITSGVNFLFIVVGGGFVTFVIWVIKRRITKVDDTLETAVTVDECRDCKADNMRDDEEFKQEIRDGFSDIKADLKGFKKDVKQDFRDVHMRMNAHFDPKPAAIDSSGS
jgi:hypothetical protein